MARKNRTGVASPELREQVARAETLPDDFLLCRLVGHSWSRISPDRVPPWGRIVVWLCGRCETKRDDILRPEDGGLIHRHYRYPEGYLQPQTKDERQRGGRRLPAPALRLALLRRDDREV